MYICQTLHLNLAAKVRIVWMVDHVTTNAKISKFSKCLCSTKISLQLIWPFCLTKISAMSLLVLKISLDSIRILSLGLSITSYMQFFIIDLVSFSIVASQFLSMTPSNEIGLLRISDNRW